LAGEAGIGKTELINQFVNGISDIASTNDEEIRIVKTDCVTRSGQNAKFGPFSDLMKNLIEPLYSEKHWGKEIAQILQEIAPHVLNLVPVCGSQLSNILQIVEKFVKRVKQRRPSVKQRTDDLVELKDISQESFCSEYSEILQKVSSKYPLVFIIDNLQWIDESSINLLCFLSERVRNSRILIVGAYRSEEAVIRDGQPHPLREVKNTTVIELKFLDREGVKACISELYPDNDFPENFGSFIHARTRGNCMFVVELLKFLEQEHIIAKRQGTKWSLTKEVRDIGTRIPKSVKDVIDYRMEHIRGDEDKKIHQKASVEGQKFSSDILSQLMPMDRIELSRKLRQLGDIYRLINQSADLGTEIGSYEFINPLIHDVIYDGLGKSEECVLTHRSIGDILETKYENDDRIKEFAPILALHFDGGRMPDKALKYYQIAASEAEKTNSFAEASRHYAKIDELMEKCNIGTPRERVDILIRMGAIYEILGRREDSQKALKKSLDLNPDVDDELTKAHNLTNLGITSFQVGGFDESLKHLESAKGIYESLKDDLSKEDKERYGICLDWLGVNYRNKFEMEIAESLHLAALGIGEEINSFKVRAHAIANLGAIYLWLKEFSQVTEYWKGALEISKEASEGEIEKSTWEVVHYTIDVGYIYFLQREPEQAIKYLEKGIREAQESFFEEETARGWLNKGDVLFVKTDLVHEGESALKCYEDSLKIAEKRKITKLVWRLQHNIGNVYRRQNKYDDAYRWYMSSIAYLKETISGLKSEEEKEGFLKHRLDPVRSMILLTLEREESQEFANTFGFNLLSDFLERRKQGIDLNEEEKSNLNYFGGYYVLTE
jgi:tetratricopeptide (TPR) repeat protein